jgi:hypothetical protein
LAPGAAGGAESAVRHALESARPGPGSLDGLVDLLFELAPAAPIRFDGEDADQPPNLAVGTDASAGRTAPIRLPRHPVTTREVVDGVPIVSRESATGFGSLPERVGSAAAEVLDAGPFTVLRAHALRLLGSVRTPVWIAGGAGVGALVVALTVIPSAPTSTSAPSSVPSTTPSAAPSARPSGATGPASTTPASAGASAIVGEDPLAAARALLSARTACFTSRSLTCLDGVDQAGSAVLDSDRELVRRLTRGSNLPAEATLAGFTPHLVQQLGDSAIIQLVASDGSVVADKNPAPLLLVRIGAGWRIRDLALG